MTTPSISAVLKKRAERKAKRAEKRKGLPWGKNQMGPPQIKITDWTPWLMKAKRKRKKVPARKRAFLRLKALCREFVLLRTKERTGGMCEVAMACRGQEAAVLPYHIFPAAMGNAIKYDARNILGACSRCNGSEYFARKRGDPTYVQRHLEILGPALFEELKAAQGRKQISTVEANEMAEGFKSAIENGAWRGA